LELTFENQQTTANAFKISSSLSPLPSSSDFDPKPSSASYKSKTSTITNITLATTMDQVLAAIHMKTKSGLVLHKKDLKSGGSRCLDRTWRSFWMVLSGSRILMFHSKWAPSSDKNTDESTIDKKSSNSMVMLYQPFFSVVLVNTTYLSNAS